MIEKARKAVLDYYNGRRDVISGRTLEMEEWENQTIPD